MTHPRQLLYRRADLRVARPLIRRPPRAFCERADREFEPFIYAFRDRWDEHRYAQAEEVSAWAVEADFDPAQLRSNTFSMEWPPRSGRQASFPEVDRAAWFGLDEARSRILIGQIGFLDALAARLADP